MVKAESLVEMRKFSSDVPHENVADLKFEKRIYKYEPQLSRFTAVVIPSGEEFSVERFPLPEVAEVPISGRMEISWEKRESSSSRPHSGGKGLLITKLRSRTIRIEKTVDVFLDS